MSSVPGAVLGSSWKVLSGQVADPQRMFTWSYRLCWQTSPLPVGSEGLHCAWLTVLCTEEVSQRKTHPRPQIIPSRRSRNPRRACASQSSRVSFLCLFLHKLLLNVCIRGALGGSRQAPCLKAAFSVKHPSFSRGPTFWGRLGKRKRPHPRKPCLSTDIAVWQMSGTPDSTQPRKRGPQLERNASPAGRPRDTTWQTGSGEGSPPVHLAGPAESSQMQVHQDLKCELELGAPDSVRVRFLCSPPP